MHIVIEGQDATGKDTQAILLAEHLRAQGQEVVTYAESGTGSKDDFVAEIARLNYGSDQDIDHRTRVLLYLVNRYEQWRKLAEPTLKRGGTVITSRNWFSTLIYEGYGGGVSKSLIIRVHKEVMPKRYFSPDKIVFLTLTEAERARRLQIRAESADKRSPEVWKSKPSDFQKQLNQAYLKVAKDFNIPTLDAVGSTAEVQAKLLKQFGL